MEQFKEKGKGIGGMISKVEKKGVVNILERGESFEAVNVFR